MILHYFTAEELCVGDPLWVSAESSSARWETVRRIVTPTIHEHPLERLRGPDTYQGGGVSQKLMRHDPQSGRIGTNFLECSRFTYGQLISNLFISVNYGRYT